MAFKKTLLLVVGVLAIVFFANAQELKFPSLDKSSMDAAHYPRESAYLNYLDDDTKKEKRRQIKVLYSKPRKNDREIFGKLVPYGKEWRLGANEALEVSFFQNVEIGGTFIPAGTYTMFADVYPDHWTIKISTERFIAGTANRDVSQDVVHVDVPVSNVAESREAYTIGFQRVDDESCNMVFEWDHTRATLPISFNPAYLDDDNASPMDLAQYPNDSRFRNFLKKEELDANEPKVRVVYSRPQKKGRTIFGDLLKYGELWRVGANETTEITFFQDVNVGGTDIKAGTYGLTARVHKDKWDFIIHTNIPSWGHYNHDDSKNVATFSATTEKTPSTVEALSILFDKKDDKNVHLIVAWDDRMARLPIMMK